MTYEEKIDAMQTIDNFLKWKVYRNADIMYDDAAYINGEYHISDVIAAMQDFIHIILTDEPYDYAWHWANKIGSWIDSDAVYQEMTGRRCE